MTEKFKGGKSVGTQSMPLNRKSKENQTEDPQPSFDKQYRCMLLENDKRLTEENIAYYLSIRDQKKLAG